MGMAIFCLRMSFLAESMKLLTEEFLKKQEKSAEKEDCYVAHMAKNVL